MDGHRLNRTNNASIGNYIPEPSNHKPPFLDPRSFSFWRTSKTSTSKPKLPNPSLFPALTSLSARSRETVPRNVLFLSRALSLSLSLARLLSLLLSLSDTTGGDFCNSTGISRSRGGIPPLKSREARYLSPYRSTSEGGGGLVHARRSGAAGV